MLRRWFMMLLFSLRRHDIIILLPYRHRLSHAKIWLPYYAMFTCFIAILLMSFADATPLFFFRAAAIYAMLTPLPLMLMLLSPLF